MIGAAMAVAGALLVILFLDPRSLIASAWIAATEDTQYPPGFSEAAFGAIRIGDTEAAVLEALGQPLERHEDVPRVDWLYTAQPSPSFRESGVVNAMASYTVIQFDAEGRLLDAYGMKARSTGLGAREMDLFDGANTLGLRQRDIDALEAAGASFSDIEARFGAPRERFESRVRRWLVYSRSPGSRNYRIRAIGLDDNGQVCRRRAEIYWD